MSGLRFEDLPAKAQAELLGQTATETEEPKEAPAPPGALDRLGSRLAGNWPGLDAGVLVLIGWAVLMVIMSWLFTALAVLYVVMAGIAVLIAIARAIRRR